MTPTRTTTERWRRRLLAAATLSWLALPALAHDPAGEEEPEPRWQGSAGLSFVSSTGNTDTRNLGLELRLERRPEPWGFEVGAEVERVDEDGVTTAERYLVEVRAKRALGERWELFAGALGEQDEFAGIELRTVAEAGIVANALLGPTHQLSFDLGLAWTDEDRLPPAPDSDHLGAVAGLDYEWKISDSASLTQRLTYYPNFDDTDDWRADSTTALSAAISARLALQLGYRVRYRNQPVDGREDTDTTTKVSLVVRL